MLNVNLLFATEFTTSLYLYKGSTIKKLKTWLYRWLRLIAVHKSYDAAAATAIAEVSQRLQTQDVQFRRRWISSHRPHTPIEAKWSVDYIGLYRS